MPISSVQKAAIEDVIRTLEKVQAPKSKRSLCGIFMELVDREEWPEYYEVCSEVPPSFYDLFILISLCAGNTRTALSRQYQSRT